MSGGREETSQGRTEKVLAPFFQAVAWRWLPAQPRRAAACRNLLNTLALRAEGVAPRWGGPPCPGALVPPWLVRGAWPAEGRVF